MASKTVSAPTAADVREFFRSDAKRLGRLSEDAAKTVAEGARGRLHPEVIKSYNKGRKAERQYVLGAGKAQKAEAAALREKVVAAGGGKRGPVAAHIREALTQPKG